MLLIIIHELFSDMTLPVVQDEVLAVSRKMVLRVEDLVKWACPEPTGLSSSSQLTPPSGTNGLHKPPPSSEGDVNTSLDKSIEPLTGKPQSKNH